MKILLIDPPWYSLQGISSTPPSLGLFYIGAYIKKNGHECLISSGELGITKKIKHQKVLINSKDFKDIERNPAYKKYVSRLYSILKRFRPDVVGFTAPTVKVRVVKSLAKFIKKYNSNIIIAVGGPHATILPDYFLKKGSNINFVIRNEGEESFLDLINLLEINKKDYSKINGISYIKNNIIKHNKNRDFLKDLDRLPFPEEDMLYEKKLVSKNQFGNMVSSRACPYNCTFCASKKIWGTKVRYRSVENIFKEMKMKKDKGVNLITFNDDSFTIKKDRVLKLCDLIIKNKLKINWECDTRVNLINYSLLKKMKKAGCVQIGLGIECGNDKMLKYLKKGITIKQIEEAFRITKKLKIATLAYFMSGFPEETEEDMMDTIKLMKKVKPTHPCWSIATPYPGTQLYEECLREGLINKDVDWEKFHHHSKEMGFSKYIPKDRFIKIAEKIEKITFRIKAKYYLLHPIRLIKELKII